MVSRSNSSCHISQRCARSKRNIFLVLVLFIVGGFLIHYSRNVSLHSDRRKTETSKGAEGVETINNPPQDDITIRRLISEHYAQNEAISSSEDKSVSVLERIVLKDPQSSSNATLCTACNSTSYSNSIVTMSPIMKEFSTIITTHRVNTKTATVKDLQQKEEAMKLLETLKKKCSSPKRHSAGPHSNLTFLHQPNIQRICQSTRPPLVILLVFSTAEHHVQRSKIRKTWAALKWSGHMNSESSSSSSFSSTELHRVETLFLVSHSSDVNIQRQIQRESDQEDDILQIVYSNKLKERTHFHLLGFHYLFQHCHDVPYVVVLEDENFVNVPHLLLQLTTMNSMNNMNNNQDNKNPLIQSPTSQPQIVCNILNKVKAIRDFRNPLHVTRSEWSRIRYPPHCDPGVPYFLNGAALHSLLFCAYHQPYFWMDNVFITGILPQLVNVSLHSFWSGFSYTKMMAHHAYSLEVHDHIFLTEGALLDERTWLRIHQLSLLSHIG